MKTYIVTLAIEVCLLQNINSEIINGYQGQIVELNNKIENLIIKLDSLTNKRTQNKIHNEIRKLEKKCRYIKKYYQKTDSLIQLVKYIDSELFLTVSNVRNACGKITDVYIQVLPNNSIEYEKIGNGSLLGYTYIAQWSKNPKVYASKFGINTVSIVVADISNSIFALAHELGHVIYQVPNLEEYVKFFKSEYTSYTINKYGSGHSPLDPGLKKVKEIEQKFYNNYQIYLHEDNPILIVNSERKN